MRLEGVKRIQVVLGLQVTSPVPIAGTENAFVLLPFHLPPDQETTTLCVRTELACGRGLPDDREATAVDAGISRQAQVARSVMGFLMRLSIGQFRRWAGATSLARARVLLVQSLSQVTSELLDP
jgi:hypothetical protein